MKPDVIDTIQQAVSAELQRRKAGICATEDLKTVRVTVVLNPRNGAVQRTMIHLEAEYDHRQAA